MKNRAERKIFFLVVWLTMISCISGYGQDFYKMGIKKDFLGLAYPGTPAQSMSQRRINSSPNPFGDPVFRSPSDLSGKTYSGAETGIAAVPSNIYYTQSGIMCKAEWQIEKATHVPIRFRLGSLADCNVMEGKR
jgi:hypothetical protein